MVSRVGKKDIVRIQKHLLPQPFLLETLRNSGPEPMTYGGIRRPVNPTKISLLLPIKNRQNVPQMNSALCRIFAHAIVPQTLADRYQRFAPSELPA
jgi:hypothetical protein